MQIHGKDATRWRLLLRLHRAGGGASKAGSRLISGTSAATLQSGESKVPRGPIPRSFFTLSMLCCGGS